jgi:hypothetical protein
MKEQLESVVLQMYKAGVRCSEAVREFQKAFILTVLKDESGNQCSAAKKLGVHRNTLRRSEIWRLTSFRHEQRGDGDHRDRSFQFRRHGSGRRNSRAPYPAKPLSLPTWQSTHHR